MTDFQYQISNGFLGEGKTALVRIGDGIRVVPGTHPYWDGIVELLEYGNADEDAEQLADLLELDRAVTKFVELSDRLTFKDEHLYFDGDVVQNDLSETLVKLIQDGEKDPQPLVNFFENLETNPSEQSKESLWRWLNLQHLTVTPDGHFLAYKGVTIDGLSINSGKATVDGEEVKGKIPNKPGSTITMPRSTVDDNTHNYCSTGLHAGNFRYANSFGSKVLLVKINPRDVVSVPLDSNNEKLRVCRYVVLTETDKPIDAVYYEEPSAEEELLDQMEDHASRCDDGCCGDECCDECHGY